MLAKNRNSIRIVIDELEALSTETAAQARYTPSDPVPARTTRKANRLISDILYFALPAHSSALIFSDEESELHRFDVFSYALQRWLRLVKGLVQAVSEISLELQGA